MSLVKLTLNAISQIMTELGSVSSDSGHKRKIVSLGYPDILVDKQGIASAFGEEFVNSLRFREDSDAILRWHNLQNKFDEVPDSYHFFEKLGYHLDVIDIEAARGNEIILNLNDPMPESLMEQYHIVLDAGTLEHCFNIAQAMKNIAEMVVEGGYIMQGNPLNWFNHGFYNLNPTFYYDFYQQNGFDIVFYEAVINSVLDPKTFKVPAFDRFGDIPPNATNLLVIQRTLVQPISWPIQTKYRNNPYLKN